LIGAASLLSKHANIAVPIYDIAIIGGGINGCGIARDAAGRGYRAFLAEKGDLVGKTNTLLFQYEVDCHYFALVPCGELPRHPGRLG
jgi:heterodisulfide reductase subunit A-like polyferredoxin